MPIHVIGAGFGRTGTQSLKVALEYLGYQPCYSMMDLLSHRPGLNDGHLETWHNFVCAGRAMDWPRLLAGYEACLDAPVHYFFPELLEAFPQAVVVLTVRDSQRWFASWQAMQEVSARVQGAMRGDARMRKWGELMHVLRAREFGGAADREAIIRVFEARITAVKATVPPERLLIFDVQHGWAPLCAFLRCPVPGVPFPHENDRAALQRNVEAFLRGERPGAGS